MKNSSLENGKCRNRKEKLGLVKKEAELKTNQIFLSQNCIMFYKMVVYGSKIQYRLTFTRKRIINKPN